MNFLHVHRQLKKKRENWEQVCNTSIIQGGGGGCDLFWVRLLYMYESYLVLVEGELNHSES